MRPILAAALLGVLAVACRYPETAPKPLPVPAPTTGQLGSGDIFEVRVYGEPELSGTYRVSPEGTIDFPLVGRVEISRLTASAVSEDLTERLRRYVKDPHVSVYVKEYNSQKIFVFGEVQRPGTFKFEEGMSIVEAITMAGGFNKIADKDGTYVTRMIGGEEQRIRVSVAKIGEGKIPNLELEPGDIVYVPEALF